MKKTCLLVMAVVFYILSLCSFSIANRAWDSVGLSAEIGGLKKLDVKSIWGYGTCYAAEPKDSIIFAGSGRELIVLNVEDPAHPQKVSHLTLDDYVNDIDLGDGYAYVGTYASFSVVDIKNIHSPKLMGRIPSTREDINGTMDVEVNGRYAYAADSSNLRIFDISDPSNPVETSRVASLGFIQGVFLQGDYLFTTEYRAGFRIFEVSDPYAPVMLAHVNDNVDWWNDRADNLFAVGSFLYVANAYSGLWIYDISDINNPLRITTMSFSFWIDDVEIFGNYAYLSALQGGLRVVDVSDPYNPVEIGFLVTPGVTGRAKIMNGHVVLADTDAVRLIDISDPYGPILSGEFTLPNLCYHIAYANNFVFVSAYLDGLRVVRTVPGGSPEEVAFLPTPGGGYEVELVGDILYFNDLSAGLQIIDIADPYFPKLLSTFKTQDQASGLFVEDNKAYIADRQGGLRIIDVSDPESPNEIGSYIFDIKNAWDVVILNGLAYVTDQNAGLYVLDVTEPSEVQMLGYFPIYGNIRKIKVQDNLAFIVDMNYGLRILDVSNPTAIAEVGSYETSGISCSSVLISNNIAYIGAGPYLFILDISNPSNPLLIEKKTLRGRIVDLNFGDGDLVIAQWHIGFTVLK